MPEFVHLHCHTQYSLLDGASEIGAMMDKAAADGQKGVALTDHGNMFGAFKFVAEATKRGIKPIIGCEFYLVKDRFRKSFSRAKNEKDKRHHQLLLAKNRKGYENLIKLCSIGFIDGLYGKFPRIDKEILQQHTEGLVATSCCIGAEIPQTILHQGEEAAEEKLKWWLDVFGREDFYIELQRHKGLDDIDGLGVSQEDINQVLIKFAKKYELKLIATNDSHYVEEDDWQAHDMLLCINTGSLIENEKRFKFPSSDFFFKSQQQMNVLFEDVPEAIDNTMEIFDKIETLTLARDVLLPAYPIPEGFSTQDDYLKHMTYEGAKKRYGEITEAIRERLDFELAVIQNSGYPGYFLIVQDFTNTARDMDVSVGPGRGSAAGSAVAYCIGITNVDPIKYDLLFERFLNPERVSLPDIDIDFDDEGRDRVIKYVIDTYGKNQVAQIVTYGTMAAKSSLRDVGRVMNIPLSEVDVIAKSFPEDLSANLRKVLADGDIQPKLKAKMKSEDVQKAYALRERSEVQDEIGEMIRTAKKLEGSIRNTGIHACGVVITPDDITKYVPVKVDKGAEMLVSQFDNSVAEDAGLLKMDFLGLKTLTIIKNALKMVAENYDIVIDPDEIPLEDELTYELFQRGETVGVFQYESPGMQKYMKELVPTKFEDLIAMNALYRPGPLEYIPNFIARKHGREPITYDLDDMQGYLEETYGITVYQEQVMLLSQKLANFTKGQADMLRKAMGKKKKDLIDKLHPLFIEGGTSNGHDEDTLNKVWKDWEAFASYAFNKSHSTCYAYIAFQTAYLKAHYPAEFMASVLTNNKSDIKKIHFFLDECYRMGIEVLGPNINESKSDFSVNKKGQIRFGMSALKGVGEGPVEAILEERANGSFTDIFNVMKRINFRAINKRVIENLALGGAFDLFEDIHRAQYFAASEKYATFIEHLVRFGNGYQNLKAQSQNSLFGGSDEVLLPDPKVPIAEQWPLIVKLEKEKEVTGIYISGHPLDPHKIVLKYFVSHTIKMAKETENIQFKVAGLVTKADHRISQAGTGWGIFSIQDYSENIEFALFKDDYLEYKKYLDLGQMIYLKGIQRKNSHTGQVRMYVEQIKLLEGLTDEFCEKITIKIDILKVNEVLVDSILSLCHNYPGTHKLKLHLVDQDDKVHFSTSSSLYKVNINNNLLRDIEDMGLQYKINDINRLN